MEGAVSLKGAYCGIFFDKLQFSPTGLQLTGQPSVQMPTSRFHQVRVFKRHTYFKTSSLSHVIGRVPKICIALLCCFQRCSKRNLVTGHSKKRLWALPQTEIVDWTLYLPLLEAISLDSFKIYDFLFYR